MQPDSQPNASCLFIHNLKNMKRYVSNMVIYTRHQLDRHFYQKKEKKKKELDRHPNSVFSLQSFIDF